MFYKNPKTCWRPKKSLLAWTSSVIDLIWCVGDIAIIICAFEIEVRKSYEKTYENNCQKFNFLNVC